MIDCSQSGRKIHVDPKLLPHYSKDASDQIPRRVCSIWSLTSLTPPADFQPWQMRQPAGPWNGGKCTLNLKTCGFSCSRVRSCLYAQRCCTIIFTKNHQKSMWSVGLLMGLQIGKGAPAQPICHVTSGISFSSTAISAGEKDTEGVSFTGPGSSAVSQTNTGTDSKTSPIPLSSLAMYSSLSL